MKTKNGKPAILQKFNSIFNTSSLLSDLSYLKRKTAARFTLIELLVVIAIIAILLRSKWLFFCYFLLFLRFRFLMRKRLTLKYRM